MSKTLWEGLENPNSGFQLLGGAPLTVKTRCWGFPKSPLRIIANILTVKCQVDDSGDWGRDEDGWDYDEWGDGGYDDWKRRKRGASEGEREMQKAVGEEDMAFAGLF